MNKSDYLSGNDVEAFIKWMSANLDNATFRHAYVMRVGKIQWQCDSLFDAYKRYQWRHVEIAPFKLPSGNTAESNVRVLDTLQTELRDGLAAGDNERVFRAAQAVMQWGGVTGGNVEWLKNWRNDLCRIIGATRDAINAGDTDHPLFDRTELRFTSGMSKVYSLVCDDFAIYDSRVAAALCRAVVLFCRDTGRTHVPDQLNFPWAAAKSSADAKCPPLRNAAQDEFKFSRLVRGRAYARWNMKASWVLSAIVSHGNARNSAFASMDSKAQRLRALEMALFMFGYDLIDQVSGATNHDSAAPVAPAEPENGADVTTDDNWVQCKTAVDEVPFEYRLTAQGIQTRRDHADTPINFTDAELNGTLQRLLAVFENRPFPLRNDMVEVPRNPTMVGFGRAFWEETKRSPRYTSRLAAVLQSIDVFVRCENPPANGRHWTLEFETLGIKSAADRVNIRPHLDDVIQGDVIQGE
ncbi:hypothetical protein [Paraburkholderia sp. Ac-20347]|uniref:hypothetical protein n=1 Tax=Paraburkholderia sp. Ac-20347 TaxID=2703892 RepID=UPI001980C7C7|nr:hypothetical protein [Paraburkholderia sp. Ac-20347]MBN3808965.1 hypothetical protein [Paraburkholderia sp. Ac-20347]